MHVIGRRDFLATGAAATAAGLWPRRSAFRPQAPDQVAYHLRYDADAPGRLVVTLTPPPAPGPLDFIMPRAIPMGYGVAPYDAFVEGLRAWSPSGEQLPSLRQDGPRWRVGRPGTTIQRLRYTVDLHRMEEDIRAASDASKSRDRYLGLLGYSVLGFLEGLDGLPVRVDVRAPVSWPVFCTLAPQAPALPGPQAFEAADYYSAADAQYLLGPSVQVRALAGSIPLFLAGYTEGPADLGVEGSLAEEAFRLVVTWFGGAPFRHYSAVVEYLRPISPDHDYGFSMEHLDSSTYFLAAGTAPTPASTVDVLSARRFNYAHHIAHSWVPKRAYGEGYYPFRWELPPVIDSIWFSEGFARWIAIEALAGGLPPDERDPFRARALERHRGILEALPATFRSTPLVALSRIGSTQYSTDFRVGQALFCRGLHLATEVDAAIRTGSAGARSLRDALRGLLAWSAKERRGFRVDELPRLLGEPVSVELGPVFSRGLA